MDGAIAWVSNSETAFRPANRTSSCRCKALMRRIKFLALFSPITNKDQMNGILQRGRCANQDNKENIYHEALAAGNKEEAMALVRNGDPKCFWLNYDKLSSNYDKISFTPPLPYVHQFTDTVWIVPTTIHQWVAENIKEEAQRSHRPKSIIIEGSSRIGKTCWVRSLGPHNYYSGHIDLRDHNDDAFYNIIDDVAPQYLKHWREFIGAQRDFFFKL
ncbi:hypothetical protein TEA_028748 [Camellia sinensis var. sinensis]|uniref:Geminivirus AL1 replication-associated protein central domain-containing protein n=1 Tax=Camellia sinensis var. sinensis TaxID=542762 RepID=A0A4S4EDZ9_CAMSN|nr:hypothetical protein TEA_028748 [Camellia sinensis var. sinensis]